LAARANGSSEKVKLVSFVMPALNEARNLAAAVASVVAQKLPRGVRAELVIALGPSDDGTSDLAWALVAQHSGYEIRLVEVRERSTPVSLNRAIAETTGEVVVRVDGHSELEPDYTAKALAILAADPARGNVGGLMNALGKTDFERAVAWAYTSRWGLGGGKFHVGGAAGPVDSVYLGVFRRSALDAVGSFDERMKRAQDWELNQRLREAGWVVWFDPSLRVGYTPRGSALALARQFFKTGQWRGRISRSSLGSTSLRYFAPPLLVLATPLGFPLLVYLAAVFLIAISSDLEGRAQRWLLVVLPIMHYTWGVGFIWGLLVGAEGRSNPRG
jgi:glycosyltransferase involved in cell wall biosynthesis